MKIKLADEAHAISLLMHDVEATLGAGHENQIRREASVRRKFFNRRDTIDVTSDEYLQKVAEEVQQFFHDCFVDITWPECPFHRRHPLWLHNGSWTCEQLHAPVARLGELRTIPGRESRYCIVVD